MTDKADDKILAGTFPGWLDRDFPAGTEMRHGKVRDIVRTGASLAITASDRISAFDRILGLVPYKGEILTGLTEYWFEHTADIVQNHLKRRIGPRTILVKECDVVPVEVVVRGYLTGSAWRDYQAGRPISGVKLPDGMRFNQRLDAPLVTPSTKEESGTHDRPISGADVVASGAVQASLWERIESVALSLFARGSEICAHRGLILVDTKYEFGLADGELVLVDEIHTPDSSRFWYADTYEDLFERGEKQRKIDKEYLRQWLMEHGYMGDGDPPEIPDEVIAEVSRKYITAYQTITSRIFRPSTVSIEAELNEILSTINRQE